MHISDEYLELGTVDSNYNLFKELQQYNWDEWDYRQNKFEVHKHTKSIPIIWADNLNEKPFIFANTYKSFIKYVEKLQELTSNKHGYDLFCMRAMFAQLPGFQQIEPHIDLDVFFDVCHRIHWCVYGDFNKVNFIVNEKRVPLQTGKIIEINNKMEHSVNSYSNVQRIHMICDFLPI